MINKIIDRVNKNTRIKHISKHIQTMDPDLNFAYYKMMNYINKNKLMDTRHSGALLNNIFDLFITLSQEKYDNLNLVQRIFKEIFKLLNYKFKIFKK